MRINSNEVSTTIPGATSANHLPIEAKRIATVYDVQALAKRLVAKYGDTAKYYDDGGPGFRYSPLQVSSLTDGHHKVVAASVALGTFNGEPTVRFQLFDAKAEANIPVTPSDLAAAMPSAQELAKWLWWVEVRMENSPYVQRRPGR